MGNEFRIGDIITFKIVNSGELVVMAKEDECYRVRGISGAFDMRAFRIYCPALWNFVGNIFDGKEN